MGTRVKKTGLGNSNTGFAASIRTMNFCCGAVTFAFNANLLQVEHGAEMTHRPVLFRGRFIEENVFHARPLHARAGADQKHRLKLPAENMMVYRKGFEQGGVRFEREFDAQSCMVSSRPRRREPPGLLAHGYPAAWIMT